MTELHAHPSRAQREHALRCLAEARGQLADGGADALLARLQAVLADGHRALRPNPSPAGVEDAA